LFFTYIFLQERFQKGMNSFVHTQDISHQLHVYVRENHYSIFN